jgi:hypothetical protein
VGQLQKSKTKEFIKRRQTKKTITTIGNAVKEKEPNQDLLDYLQDTHHLVKKIKEFASNRED